MRKLLTADKVTVILSNTGTSLLVEGLVPDERTVQITREYLERNITEEEALEKIIAVAKNSLS
jgi:hypothetical protein